MQRLRNSYLKELSQAAITSEPKVCSDCGVFVNGFTCFDDLTNVFRVMKQILEADMQKYPIQSDENTSFTSVSEILPFITTIQRASSGVGGGK